MMRAITLAAAVLLVAGSARADWQETIDLLYPDCRHTPLAQMTRGRIEECQTIERALRGMDEAIAKEREDRQFHPLAGSVENVRPSLPALGQRLHPMGPELEIIR